MKSLKEFEKEWKSMDSRIKSLVVAYGEVLAQAYRVNKAPSGIYIHLYQEWGTNQFIEVASCNLKRIIAINGFLGSCDLEMKRSQVKGFVKGRK